jgi:hypothetical protein
MRWILYVPSFSPFLSCSLLKMLGAEARPPVLRPVQ